ncbi:hypothetical protein [Adhaeribacter pallidiroseus]|nr:hypothetical protein [Adhaeribacter pallidiroseus]RDC62538.1 hypothetical protein AHMF7616_01132 [Adhaeribacter pallidiroseus]
MKEGYKFIIQPDGSEREIDWPELNHLKKDILWIFDENYGDLGNAFVPSYSFSQRYWEYLTLDGDKWFYEEDKAFYHRGLLIILLCCCSEYIDIPTGSQEVFPRQDLPIIAKYVEEYNSKSKEEILLKDKILLGLNIAQSIPEDDLKNKEYVHPKVGEYHKDINEIGNPIIENYFKSILEK